MASTKSEVRKKRWTEAEVIGFINDAIAESGSQAAYAHACDISTQYLHDIVNRRRGIGEKVLKALGLRRCETEYEDEVSE